MKRVYISGAMTGVDNFEEFFQEAENTLTEAGFAVINPAKTPQDEEILERVMTVVTKEDTAQWASFVLRDLAYILTCSHILFLPGWTNSLGARIEFFFAAKLGLKTMFIDQLEATEFLDFHDINFKVTGTLIDDKDGDWFKRQMG